MAYASVGSVEKLDGAITFTQITPVTKPEVENMLADTAAELDGILAAQDYLVPVDPTAAPISYRLLGRYNALGADAAAQSAWPDSPRADRAEKAWERALEMLKEGKVELPDAPRDTEDLQVRVSVGAQGVATPFFTRDMCL